MERSIWLFLTFFLPLLIGNNWAGGTKSTKGVVDYSKYGLTLPADIVRELSNDQEINNCSIFNSSAYESSSSSSTNLKETCAEYFADQIRSVNCAIKMNKTRISSSEKEDMAYEYGTAAILVISIIPFFLFLAVPSEKKWFFPYVMTFLM